MINCVEKFEPIILTVEEVESLFIPLSFKEALSEVLTNLGLLCIISGKFHELKPGSIDKKGGKDRFPVTDLKGLYFIVLRDIYSRIPRGKLSKYEFYFKLSEMLESRNLYIEELLREKIDLIENICTRAKQDFAAAGFARILMTPNPFSVGLYPLPKEIDEHATGSVLHYPETLRRKLNLGSLKGVVEIDLDYRLKRIVSERKLRGRPGRLEANKQGRFLRTRLLAPSALDIKSWFLRHKQNNLC